MKNGCFQKSFPKTARADSPLSAAPSQVENQAWSGQKHAGDCGWQNYVMVFDAGLVSRYWDGMPPGTVALANNFFAAETTHIGFSAPVTTTGGWPDGLDEVAYCKTALGAESLWSHLLAVVGPDLARTPSFPRVREQRTLFWPAEAVGFILESTESLAGPSWMAGSGVVNNRVTVDTSGGRQFFRLKQ